jgi:hypothetical protein
MHTVPEAKKRVSERERDRGKREKSGQSRIIFV